MTEQSTIRLGNDVAGVVVRTGTPGAEVPARPLGLRATGQRPDRHLRGVIEIADLREGQKIPIHAGSGGVGTFAIQLGLAPCLAPSVEPHHKTAGQRRAIL